METWNQTQGIETARFISDNITRTGLNIAIGGSGDYVFNFSFKYGSNNNIPVSHSISFPLKEVIAKWNGNLADAIIHYEYHGFTEFKSKLREYLKFEEDDTEIEQSNRINRIKSE